MILTDFDGEHCILTEAELLCRLRSVRRGAYGAFILQHDADVPSLWVQFNSNIAYLHFFPEDDHPGLCSTGKTPEGCEGSFHFLQVNNSEADSFDMDSFAIMNADDAYTAAIEFFHSATAPPSIEWIEL